MAQFLLIVVIHFKLIAYKLHLAEIQYVVFSVNNQVYLHSLSLTIAFHHEGLRKPQECRVPF